MISIKFCGAAQVVTGSNFLVKTDRGNFVVDCGMFQGVGTESWNLNDFDYDPSEVDFALLTHSHIDHSGMFPKLVKHGFDGPIYCTHHTAQITTHLLLDSAKIQEGNFKRKQPYGKHTNQVVMVYNSYDASRTIDNFKTVQFQEEFSPVEGIKVKYLRVGHVLGAASIEVTIEDEGEQKKIIFSGDIGRTDSALVEDTDLNYSADVDYVVMESLYGGKYHPDRNIDVQELLKVIAKTIDRGGTVYIPAFSLQRTQELMNELKKAKDSGALGQDVPVWLDSPLAQKITKIYSAALQHTEEDLFDFEGMKYVRNYRQSQRISNRPRNIIIAGSGMADGGRIMSHLRSGLLKDKNSVIFVGYQAEGTMGRELVEGADSVELDGRRVDVNAQIHHFHGFSAHGDTDDYIKWLNRFVSPELKNVYLVHADLDRAETLKKVFEEKGFDHPYVPEMNEEIALR